jgi:transcriptional regulator with PAS, ATPase and Fis domain
MEVCKDMNRDYKVYIGDLQEGVKIAKNLEAEGVDAIISRGGTALAITEVVKNVPVVEIMVAGSDIIKVLNKLQYKFNKVAIVGFKQFTHTFQSVAKILNINIEIFTLKQEWYNHETIIKEKLINIKEKGFNCIIGDNISVKIAKKMNLSSYLIRSGKEAISQSIKETERIVRVREKEIEKRKRIKGIIDFSYEGIISIDQKGIIKTFNSKAEEIFNKKAYKVLDRQIDSVLPKINLKNYMDSGRNILNKIWTYDGQGIVGNIIPILVDGISHGLVLIVQEASNIKKTEEKIRKKLHLKGYFAEASFRDIIGESDLMQKAIEESKDYAMYNLPLLIHGETGTGKELFAQAIHNYSPRKKSSFVAFNCAALPEKLLESELFGYVQGAFTGASSKGKTGLFEQAHGGTIFLDEIGEISKSIQSRLLRVLEERKIRRIGDDKLISVDVRLIMATNRDLNELVKKNKYRKDFYYRINVLNLKLPPLKERKSDINLLVNYLIKKINLKLNKNIKSISDEGLKYLNDYDWPGNVRELENFIKRLIVRSKRNIILNYS